MATVVVTSGPVSKSTGFLSPPAPRGLERPGRLFRVRFNPPTLRAGLIAGPFFDPFGQGADKPGHDKHDGRRTCSRLCSAIAPRRASASARWQRRSAPPRPQNRCRRTARPSPAHRSLGLARPIAELDPAPHHIGVGDGVTAVLAAADDNRNRSRDRAQPDFGLAFFILERRHRDRKKVAGVLDLTGEQRRATVPRLPIARSTQPCRCRARAPRHRRPPAACRPGDRRATWRRRAGGWMSGQRERVLPAEIVPVVDRRLIAMTRGIGQTPPMSLSAGGQDEQPWLVNSSSTARGSACARLGRQHGKTRQRQKTSERERKRDLETNHHVLQPPRPPAKPGILDVLPRK